jgi:hypothetical protein
VLLATSQDARQWPACRLQQQGWYSQAAQPADQQQQKQQQEEAPSESRNGRGNSATANPSSSSSNGDGGSKRSPDTAAGISRSNSVGRKAYTGATTAADHHRRGTTAAVQQLDPLPVKQQQVQQQEPQQAPPPPQQQQQPDVLQVPQQLGQRQEPAPKASSKQLREQLREQQWEVEYKHHRSQQPQHQLQQQQQQLAGSQKHVQQQPASQQPQGYKIVQYSRGNSLMLSLSTEPGGEYSLTKTKGPASAADLAAFRRTKPAKDGAAAAAKAAKEVPLLLRPFQQYFLRVKKVLQATFLPSGYPTSVGSNYLEYTLWQVRDVG